MTETKPIEAAAGHYQAVMKDTLIFDSHGYVKRMTDGGFNEQQAETLAAEQADLLSNLATRQDIVTVRQDIETVKDGLEMVKNELEEVKKNMVTKDDLKDELKDFATKDDLKDFATKDDLKDFATKGDLKDFATKQDVEVSMQKLKVEMIKWMTWYFLSGLAVMAAVLKLA